MNVNPVTSYDEENNNEADIANIIYAKLNDHSTTATTTSSSSCSGGGGAGSSKKDTTSERNTSGGGGAGGGSSSSVIGGRAASSSVDHGMSLEGYSQVPPPGTQPSMSGSLSSIVHSEEELTGSYNWDYLLDWGPQYQPLAHVFSEIARLKDDATSVKSGTSGTTSSNKSKCPASINKTVLPPPNLTNVAPRSVVAPILSNRPSTASAALMQQHSTPLKNHQMLLLPRSPISHDTVSEFSTSAAMSPSFSPSLSPLATRSPSNSPLHLHSVGGHHNTANNNSSFNNVGSNNNSSHHIRQRHHNHHLKNDKDVRI